VCIMVSVAGQALPGSCRHTPARTYTCVHNWTHIRSQTYLQADMRSLLACILYLLAATCL
jgi:hypothetical protein